MAAFEGELRVAAVDVPETGISDWGCEVEVQQEAEVTEVAGKVEAATEVEGLEATVAPGEA